MNGSQYNPYFNQPVYGAVVGEHNIVNINVPSLDPSPPPLAFRSIVGIPPLTDSPIQQRTSLVETIYKKLNEPSLNALVLTGIGGVGKSTLAALVYRYAEAHLNGGQFTTLPLWLTVDANATFGDLVGTIYQALNILPPSLRRLSPANQAQELFSTLASMKSPRLIVLDQFENFLDWSTGVVLPVHQAVGEWLNALNNQPFHSECRLLLTSRPRPQGTSEYPARYLHEYSVEGLTTAEGIDLLRKQGVQSSEEEMRKAVIDCNGHALSLTLLVSLVQKQQIPLTVLLVDPAWWEGNIAINLLEAIFTHLNVIQRKLLRDFSVYDTPVPIEVVVSQQELVNQIQVFQALNGLFNQHLIEPVGEGRYQLHAIVAHYVKLHFVEDDEQANQRAVKAAQAHAAQYKYRQRTVEKVRAIWINGALEQAVHGAALIPLQFEERRDILAHSSRALLMEEQVVYPFPRGTPIKQVFDEAGGQLLILGEPGSGKTTTLLELARDLLNRAEKDKSYPMPVIFNLSSWSVKRLPLAEWLIEELNGNYQVSRKLGNEWVRADQVLPLLDGLDEVSPEARTACIEAINTYLREHSQVPMVVCSREAEYLAQTTQLQLNHAITIRPLDVNQMDTYLENAGERFESVRTVLRKDPVFQELATTPLMLSVLALATYGKTADDILAVNTPQAEIQQVFSIYVQGMLQRRGIRSHYPWQLTTHWLAWLARQMAQHNQTIFYLERLQPDWLEGRRSLLAYRVAPLLIIVLASGLVFGLVSGLAFGLVSGLAFGLVSGLVFGSASGLFFKRNRNIRPSEIISWSWQRVMRRLNRVLFGSIVFGLIAGLLAGVTKGLVTGLVAGLIGGLGIGLLYMLLNGLSSEWLSEQVLVTPNQGIWNSARNAIFIGQIAGLVGGLVGGSIGVLFGHLVFGLLIGGFVFVLLGGLIFGGYAFIQHFILRFFLWRAGSIPWRYSRFLDYASERILMRKVGGGYIFIHRLLLDYFALFEANEKKEG